MKTSQELYDLVRSTSPAEKRFFRARIPENRSGQANLYLRLFDLLVEADAYDEPAIKAHFAGEPCLRQFTRLKNYLYEALLDALQSFHASKKVEMKVRADLDKVQILADKSLASQAYKRLRRCKQLAEKYDLSGLLPHILQWERKLLKQLRGKTLAARLQQQEQAEKTALHRLQEEQDAYARHDEIMQLVSRREDAAEVLRDFPLPAAAPASFNGHLAHLLSQALRHRHFGDRTQAHSFYQQILRHWQASPHQIAAFPERYEKAVGAFLFSAHSVGDYSAHDRLLEDIRQAEGLTGALKSTILCISYNIRLLYLMNTRRFSEAESLAPTIAAELEPAKLAKSPWLPTATNLSLLYFILEDQPAARHWCKRILDLPRNDERRDLKALMRILHLLLLYEQGDLELIPYFLKSLQRYIRQQRDLNPMELALGRFLQECLRAATPAGVRIARTRLAARLEKPDLDPALTGLEELKIWVNSRLRGLAMRDYLEAD